MALALLEALKTVAVEVNRSEIEDAVGSLVGRPGGESGPSRERDRDSTGRSEAKGGERRRGGGGAGEGGREAGGLEKREQWEHPLATSLVGRMS